MSRTILDKTIDVLMSAVIFMALLFVVVGMGHCAETTKRSEHKIVNFYENPNTYLYAEINGGVLLQDDEGRYFTNMNFHPYKSNDLYDEQVLFCGNMTGNFSGKKGFMLIVYEKTVHRMLGTVGCHRALTVIEIQVEEQ